MGRKVSFLLAIIVTASLILPLCSSCTTVAGLVGDNNPSGVVGTFMDAVIAGDVDGCVDCLSLSFQHNIDNISAIPEFLLKFIGIDIDVRSFVSSLVEMFAQKVNQNVDYHFDGIERVDDTHAMVKVDIYVDSEKWFSMMIHCVRSENGWYIEKIS